MNDYDFYDWFSTYAHCPYCGYTWVTMVPSYGLYIVECPNCHHNGETT